MTYFGTFGKPTVRAHNIILIIKDIMVFSIQYSSVFYKRKKNLKSFEDGLNL